MSVVSSVVRAARAEAWFAAMVAAGRATVLPLESVVVVATGSYSTAKSTTTEPS